VKLYHRASRDEQGLRREKLCAMLSAGEALIKHPRLAWPRSLVVDAQGAVIGFGMRRVSGVPLVPLTALALLRRDLPRWTQLHLCRVVHDISEICRLLESHKVFVGDINLNNILTGPENAQTCLIDCDSYQVNAGSRVFPSKVYTPDYSAPEILRQPERLRCLGPDQFRFSAALLFFNLLTHGGHPFQIKGSTSPEQNIIEGRHFLGPRGVATGYTTDAIYSRYRSLPPRICYLFKQAFIDGHTKNPGARPSFTEWVDATREYYSNLNQNPMKPL
jgi:DNA-binding helix-hairpin-helix protein with protein kinase domain